MKKKSGKRVMGKRRFLRTYGDTSVLQIKLSWVWINTASNESSGCISLFKTSTIDVVNFLIIKHFQRYECGICVKKVFFL